MEEIKIGNACDILNGFAFKSDQYVDEGIRVIRIANVQKGYIEDNAPAFYPVDTKGIEKYMLDEGDLLMSLTGNVGRVAILEKEMLPAALNQRVACLRLKTDKIEKGYLFHILNSDFFEKKCIQASNGVTQKNMSTEWLKEFSIPVYSKEEQKKITIILDKLRNAINIREKELHSLDELIKARFVEMFGDPIENPMGWDTKPLLSMGKCKNGMNFHYDEEGVAINCLGVGDFKDNSIISDTGSLPEITLNEMPSDDYLLKDDDIVFVRSNGNKALVGRSVAVYPGETPTTFSGFCIRFRLVEPVIIVPYLLRVLKSESVRKKMAGRGANIQNLNQQILGTVAVPIPPMELQKQFSNFMAQTDKSKVAVQKALNEAQLLFDSLMQEYFG